MKQEPLEEVECNNCGYLMSLTEDESVYACYNSECTSCYEEYEEEPSQDNRMYSEEEVIDLLVEMNSWPTTFEGKEDITEWFEQFKKK